MVRAVALRFDRLLLDTKAVETGFARDMCAVLHEYVGVSPHCVVEQARIVNSAQSTDLRFSDRRWHDLAETLRIRLASQVGDAPDFLKALDDVANTAHATVPQPMVHADLLLDAVRGHGVRVFAFGYGDASKIRSALGRWPGSENLTDVLIQPKPDMATWLEFWRAHACDVHLEAEGDPMVVFTPDPFYDPPMAFRIGSPAVLVGTPAQGHELPALPGPLEVLSVLQNLEGLS